MGGLCELRQQPFERNFWTCLTLALFFLAGLLQLHFTTPPSNLGKSSSGAGGQHPTAIAPTQWRQLPGTDLEEIQFNLFILTLSDMLFAMTQAEPSTYTLKVRQQRLAKPMCLESLVKAMTSQCVVSSFLCVFRGLLHCSCAKRTNQPNQSQTNRQTQDLNTLQGLAAHGKISIETLIQCMMRLTYDTCPKLKPCKSVPWLT